MKLFLLILVALVVFLGGMIDLLHMVHANTHASRECFKLVVFWMTVLFLNIDIAWEMGVRAVLLKLGEIVSNFIQSIYGTLVPINFNLHADIIIELR